MKGRVLGILLVSLLLLGGLGMLAGGIYQVIVKETGEQATAQITECHRGDGRYRSDVCTGMWVAGGSLLASTRCPRAECSAARRACSGRESPLFH